MGEARWSRYRQIEQILRYQKKRETDTELEIED